MAQQSKQFQPYVVFKYRCEWIFFYNIASSNHFLSFFSSSFLCECSSSITCIFYLFIRLKSGFSPYHNPLALLEVAGTPSSLFHSSAPLPLALVSHHSDFLLLCFLQSFFLLLPSGWGLSLTWTLAFSSWLLILTY